jgi:hypothetical protein
MSDSSSVDSEGATRDRPVIAAAGGAGGAEMWQVPPLI